MERGFGVGKREDDVLLAATFANDEKLDFEVKLVPPPESNLASGDARADDGVALLVFLGIRLGLG